MGVGPSCRSSRRDVRLGISKPEGVMSHPTPRPRIGVPYRTKNEQVTGDPHKIGRYTAAIATGGGEPVEIRLDLAPEELRSLAETLDGIVLSGSPADVDPSRFHASPHPKTAAPDSEREQTD